MILYISGPYSGLVDANIQAAREVAIELWEKGFTVITPHLNTQNMEVDCKATWEQYIEGDLEIISRCDGVVMMPRWRESRGSKIEREYAFYCKVPIYYYPELPLDHMTPNLKATRKFIEGYAKIYT